RAIVAESVARIFLRTSINLAYPVMIVPGVTSLVEDQQEIEIDYPKGRLRNITTGKELPLSKYPPAVERIFESGGILALLKERCVKEGLD
ncbi:MAG: 3-isopropylmalate dehydratase small subunit, partial [Candidatus Binatia bacterium]